MAAALNEQAQGSGISTSLTKRRGSVGGDDDGESFSRRGSMTGMIGGGDESFDGKRVNEEDEEDLQWNYSDGLSAWMWVNNLASVFSALFTMEDMKALDPLRRHIDTVGEEEAEWFDWLMRISEVRRMKDEGERKAAAAELYEILNDTSLSSSFDGSLVERELEVAASAFCAGLLHPAFTSILATPRGSKLIANIARYHEHGPSHGMGLASLSSLSSLGGGGWLKCDQTIPIADVSRGFLESFSATVEHFPQAVSLVDMQVAGLPLLYVNRAWEALTGYKRSDAVSHNAQMLQGESTEESAIAQMVHAIREKRTTTVIVSNYKKDGSRFRNALTLHPVSDENGKHSVAAAQRHTYSSTPLTTLTTLPFPLPLSSTQACTATL